MATGSWRISFVLMIGAPRRWARSQAGQILIATVNMALHSPFPTIVAWGPEMVFLYNDAGIPPWPENIRRRLAGSTATYFGKRGTW